MGIGVAKLAEAHTLKLWSIEQRAKNDVEAAWQALQKRVNVSGLGHVFAMMKQIGREIIGQYGQLAIDEGVRYSSQLLGGSAHRPALGDLGDTINDFISELDEHARHVQELVAIRSRRMARKGVNSETITGVLVEDFEHGGEMFGFLKNSVKRSVGSAVHQLGKEAEFAALRGGRRSKTEAA